MIPEYATYLEYQPAAPAVAERTVLFAQEHQDTLRRVLSRMGLPPHQVGFRAEDGHVAVLGRDPRTGQPAPLVKVFWGATPQDLEAARDALIAADWTPRPPRFEAELPDGRTV